MKTPMTWSLAVCLNIVDHHRLSEMADIALVFEF